MEQKYSIHPYPNVGNAQVFVSPHSGVSMNPGVFYQPPPYPNRNFSETSTGILYGEDFRAKSQTPIDSKYLLGNHISVGGYTDFMRINSPQIINIPPKNNASDPIFWVNEKIRTDGNRKKQICALVGIPEIIPYNYCIFGSVHLVHGDPSMMQDNSSHFQSLEFYPPDYSPNIPNKIQISIYLWPPELRQWREGIDIKNCLSIMKFCQMENTKNPNFQEKTGGIFDLCKFPLIACHFDVESRFRPSYTLGKPVSSYYRCKIFVKEMSAGIERYHSSNNLMWGYWNGGQQREEKPVQQQELKFIGKPKREKRKLDAIETNPLSVEEVVPPNGPAWKQNLVTIWGKGFIGPEYFGDYGVKVFFGEMEGKVDRINENFTCIKCQTPSHDPGAVTVTVQTGQMTVSKKNKTMTNGKKDIINQSFSLKDGYEFIDYVSSTKFIPKIEVSVPDQTSMNNNNFNSPLSIFSSDSSDEMLDGMFFVNDFGLMYSAYIGDNYKLRVLLSNPDKLAMIDMQDNMGATPLFWAVWGLHIDSATILLVEGNANPNIPTRCGEYPLHIACDSGDKQMIVLLVETNANINAQNIDGETPLFYAVNHPHIQQYLIQKGAKTDILNKKGKNYLNWTSEEQQQNQKMIEPQITEPQINEPKVLISQIVRKIIEDLSDGVSELVLVVVVLAENNEPIPPQLPSAANAVNYTAKTLAKIARDLAEKNFSDVKEIHTEVINAANAVDTATVTMEDALKILQGHSDKKRGWNRLTDACRLMAGKTIHLLQIVYGADLKRLQFTADILSEEITKFNLNSDLNFLDYQKKFVDDVSSIVQKSLKLGKQLNNRSEEENIGPFTRDLLRKAAGDLKDTSQSLVNVGNSVLRNPEFIPKMENILEKLRSEVKFAKQLATENAPEAPKIEISKLAPMIQKCENMVEEIPRAIKFPEKYERAEKQVREAAAAVIRQVRNNPKMKRSTDKIEAALKDQILAARKAVKNPENPTIASDIDNATEAILSALKTLKKKNPDKKLMARQKMEFEKAIENLRNSINPEQFLNKHDQQQELYERLRDNIAEMKKAVHYADPKSLKIQVRQAVAAAKALTEKMTDPEISAKYNQEQRKIRDELSKDILSTLPNIVKNATPLLKNISDPFSGDFLIDSVNHLQRIADRAVRPKEERDMHQNWNNVTNAMKKVQAAVRRGDVKSVDEGLCELLNSFDCVKNAGKRLQEKNSDLLKSNINGNLSEMEKLLEKFKNRSVQATKGDAAAIRDIENTIPNIISTWDELDKATSASLLSSINGVEDAISDLLIAAKSEDVSRVAPAFKDLVKKFQSLETPRNIFDEVSPYLREFLTKTKEVTQNTNTPILQRELSAFANILQEPLSRLKEEIQPKSKFHSNEVSALSVKKAIDNLRQVINNGDINATRIALQTLQDKLSNFNENSQNKIAGIMELRKRAILETDIEEGKELLSDLARVIPNNKSDILSLLDQINDCIDNFSDNLQHTLKDDAIKGMARANNLRATLGYLNEDDMDLGDLLQSAKSLSNLMRGLIGDTTEIARDFGKIPQSLLPIAKEVLMLDDVLREIEGKEEVISKYKPRLESPIFTPVHDDLFEEISLEQANTFEEVLAAVATEIHQSAKNLSEEADNIAKELASLAKAARNGKKQDMIVAAKSASVFIIAYCKQLEHMANKIPRRNNAEKQEQDNIFRYQQALKNYGTQLKILSSVKAASIEESRDTDATFTVLSRNLGDVVQASLLSMVTIRDAILVGQGFKVIK